MPTVSQVGQASIVLLFAFVGVEVALTPSGEIRDPARVRGQFSARWPSPRRYTWPCRPSRKAPSAPAAALRDAPLVETASRFGSGATADVSRRHGGLDFRLYRGRHAGDPVPCSRLRATACFRARWSGYRDTARRRWRLCYAAVVAALAISSSFERLVVMANVSALLLYLMCVAASSASAARRAMAGRRSIFPAACWSATRRGGSVGRWSSPPWVQPAAADWAIAYSSGVPQGLRRPFASRPRRSWLGRRQLQMAASKRAPTHPPSRSSS